MSRSSMRVIAAADPGQADVLPAPGKPMVARFVASAYMQRDSGVHTLRHRRGGWWRWEASNWVQVEHLAMRAELCKATVHAVFYVHHGVAAWDPRRHKIATLAGALAAITHLDERFAKPARRAETDVPVGTFVVRGNGLLHVVTRTIHRDTPLVFNRTAAPFDYEAPAMIGAHR